MRLLDRYRFAEGVGRAEEATEFKLDIQTSTGAERGDFGVGGGVEECLAIRTTDWRTGDYDGGGAAVVADWEVGIVWLEGICGALDRGVSL